MSLHRIDGKLQGLAQVPLFSACTHQQLVELARMFEVSAVGIAEVLQRQESVSRWWSVITKGAAVATRDGRRTGFLTSGDFFGEASILGRRGADSTITTVGPTTVLVLDGRRLLGLIRDYPSVGERIIVTLALRPAQYRYGFVA